jgi:hypothetical protein
MAAFAGLTKRAVETGKLPPIVASLRITPRTLTAANASIHFTFAEEG